MAPHNVDTALTLARTRRHFFRDCGVGVGAMALGSLLAKEGRAALERRDPLAPRKPHFAPKAKAVIYLFMAGGPSNLDLFDPKPKLKELHGQKVPESFTEGKRFAFIKGDAKLLGSPQRFARAGQCGITLSHLLPHHS